MTHSLHRFGTQESLQGDYIFLCTPAKGVNDKGCLEKLIRVLDILLEAGPASMGFYERDIQMGNCSVEAIKKALHDRSRLRCCFDDREKLKEVLQVIKKEDLGLSIAVSGLTGEILDLCEEVDLKPHTINVSCGILGRVDRLPRDEVLEITTMCGHGMIGPELVEAIVRGLRDGETDIHEAVARLGKPCTCGIFNPSRAYRLIKNISKDQMTDLRPGFGPYPGLGKSANRRQS